MDGQPNEVPNGQTSQRPAYAFYVAVFAIGAACLVYVISMLAFGDLFKDASGPLGSLFTLIGTVAGAYFGIKVSNDTSERSQGAIERAHSRTEEAHNKTERALAELDPSVARRIVSGGSGDAPS